LSFSPSAKTSTWKKGMEQACKARTTTERMREFSAHHSRLPALERWRSCKRGVWKDLTHTCEGKKGTGSHTTVILPASGKGRQLEKGGSIKNHSRPATGSGRREKKRTPHLKLANSENKPAKCKLDREKVFEKATKEPPESPFYFI